MKIVILDGKGLNPGDLSWDCFRTLGDVEIYDTTPTPELTVQRLQGAQVAITNKTPLDGSILDACPQVQLICVLATGYNVIDCDAARKRNIPVCNVPDYGTAAVAQYTFALLLELCHQVGHHDRAVHQGRWSSCPSFCFWDTPQMELAGKTLGIIGYGRIGQAVGRIAESFGMRVLFTGRRQVPGAVRLEQLLAQADVVSIHCPLTPQTQGLINAQTLAAMKPGAILINTSRGPILEEAAVKAALESGQLRCCAVDVVSREPIEQNNPLLTAPNCIITPHMAWAPVESRQRIMDATMDNIRAFLEGSPRNVVN